MRISSAFPGTYLKSADLQGRRVRVVMSHVGMEKVGDDSKPVLYFQGKEKGVVLNKTNSNAISMVYGEDTEHWTGQPIELFEAMVDFQGKTVSAIRMNVPRQAQQHSQAPLNQAPPQQRQQTHQPAYADREPPPHNSIPDRGGSSPVGGYTQQGRPPMVDEEVPF
jgi:hypothetical protein